MSTAISFLRIHRSSPTVRVRFLAWAILPLLIIVVGNELEPPVNTQASLVATNHLWAQGPIDSKWRKTRIGWVDSARWNRPARIKFERRIELIHPFTFSALMVLLSVGTLIWASDEYQWSRLIGQRPS